jgi:hypothetical protein
MKLAPRNSAELHIAYKDEIQVRMESIANGAPRDFAEYQKLVGVLTGLRLAEQMLRDLLDRDQDVIGDEPF